jgi:acetyl-CoA carboxylase beta subunit
MKNLVYVGIIGACILVAAVVFVKTRSGGAGGINGLGDEQTWVKCSQCNQSYQMSLKDFYKEQEEKAKANPTPMPIAHPLTCKKCGKDAVRKAFKCDKCGEVSFASSVPNDFEDRCPKCKYSAQEAKRKARLGQQ